MKRSPALLQLTCVGLLCTLSACVDAFPTVTPQVRGPLDAGPLVDADGTDARSPEPDAAPPADSLVPVDSGLPDMQPDMFLDPGVCRIGAPVRTVTLRTWNDTGANRVIELDTNCDRIEIESPPWVEVTLDGSRLRFEVQAARGVSEGVVALVADDRAVNIDVRRIGLEAGGANRRALVYVVDGLKGETLSESAPEALEWLAKFATRSFDAVPHDPIDDATRATGWASLLTGLAPKGHGFEGQGAIDVPTFSDRLPDRVFAALEWDVVAAGLGMNPLPRRDAIARAVTAIDSNAMLVVVGVNGLLDADLNQIEPRRAQIDADLDALLAAIAGRSADEDWLIIVTAATSGGQGPPDLPVLHAAPSLVERAAADVSLQDVHTSVLGWLRVLRPGWDLPGAQLTGGVEVECDDGADNDGDGRIDCRDADCADVCPVGCAHIDLGARTGANLVNRTMEGVENIRRGCTGDAAAGDLVISWVAPTEAAYMVSTEGSTFDTMLDPLAQHCMGPRLTPAEQCFDDPFEVDGGEPAAFYGTFAEGDLTQIFLTGWDVPEANDVARLSIINTTAACEAAPLLDVEQRGDTQGQPMALPPFARTDDLDEACARATANVLYRWRPPIGEWTITLDADFPGASVSVWDGGCGDPNPRFCQDDALNLIVPEIDEYLIVVSSSWTDAQMQRGTFTLTVTPTE